MKYRNGFISNSSSCSFVLIANTKPQDSSQYGKTWTHKITGKKHNDYEILHIKDFEGETHYCRGDIIWVKSIEEKIRYVMALYAYYYQHSKNYFKKLLSARDKIYKLGIKHWYSMTVPVPPLRAYYTHDYDYKTGKKKGPRKIETYIDVYTECCYVKDIVRMIEDKDTTKLDSFIFNKESFAVLGGDEYVETELLQQRAVNYLNEIRKSNPNFSYIRFADYEDEEVGDLLYTESDGTPVYRDTPLHWEEHCFDYEWGDVDPEDREVTTEIKEI